jgi:hypothetical protein
MAARSRTSPSTVHLRVIRDDEIARGPEGDSSQMILPPPVETAYRVASVPTPRPPAVPVSPGVLHVPPHQLTLAVDHLRALRSRVRSIGTGRRMGRKKRAKLAASTDGLEKVYARRPKTLGDCIQHVRGPCPWVTCRHHLFLEVDPVTGALTLNFPGLEVEELAETCSLRVVRLRSDDGGYTGRGMGLERVGKYLNLTLERTRQIAKEASKGRRKAWKSVRDSDR